MIPAKPVISARTVVFAVLVSLSSPLSPGRVFVKNHSSHCASATVASPEIAAFPDGIIIWLFSGSYYLVHETRQRLWVDTKVKGLSFFVVENLSFWLSISSGIPEARETVAGYQVGVLALVGLGWYGGVFYVDLWSR